MPTQKDGAAGTPVVPADPAEALEALDGPPGETENVPTSSPTRDAPAVPVLSSTAVPTETLESNPEDDGEVVASAPQGSADA